MCIKSAVLTALSGDHYFSITSNYSQSKTVFNSIIVLSTNKIKTIQYTEEYVH